MCKGNPGRASCHLRPTLEQDMVVVFASRGRGQERGKITCYRGSYCQGGSLVTMKSCRGSCPPCPFDKHCGGLLCKARAVISWALGQAYRKVSHVSKCSWRRHWSRRGCIDSKRTAILGGLITQGSWVRELVCLLSVGWFPLLFGPSEFCSLFSYLEGVQSLWKKTGFLDGTGTVVETDGSHVGIRFMFNIIGEEVCRKGTLAKVTKILLIFCC